MNPAITAAITMMQPTITIIIALLNTKRPCPARGGRLEVYSTRNDAAGGRRMSFRAGDWSIFRRERPFGAHARSRKHGPAPSAAQRGQSHFRGDIPDISGDEPRAAKIGTVPSERLTRKLSYTCIEMLDRSLPA